jgi:hypothetical protein
MRPGKVSLNPRSWPLVLLIVSLHSHWWDPLRSLLALGLATTGLQLKVVSMSGGTLQAEKDLSINLLQKSNLDT